MRPSFRAFALATTVAAALSALPTTRGDVDSWPSTETDHTKLQILLPEALTKHDGYVHKDALFGYPSYATGSLQTPLIVANSTACTPFDPATHAWETPFALLVDRGDCHFVEKVRHAQLAGARAVLIADDKCLCTDNECLRATGDDFCETVLPFMADDESGNDITIPSMLIRKSDADAIKHAHAPVQGVSNVLVKFDWGIPSPDGRVEWTLWQSAWDDQTMAIVDQLETMVRTFGTRAYFTPRFVAYNGSKVGCHVNPGEDIQPCGNMCLNRGRYCLLDPSPYHDRAVGASGADVVTENLRRKCIWQWVTTQHKDQAGMGLPWWHYVRDAGHECGEDEALFKDKACAEKIMTRYGIDTHAIETCMQPYGLDVDATNPLLEEELKEQTALQLLRLPALYVDGVHARGRIDATSVLGMICAGYGPHNPPDVCSCVDQASGNVAACVKAGSVSNAAKMANAGTTYSMGTVIAVLAILAMVMGTIGVVYYRRTQRQMRDQVRSILAEYMPLEDQALLDGEDDDHALMSPRMHPAERAAAKSPRGYLPTDGFLEDVEDGV